MIRRMICSRTALPGGIKETNDWASPLFLTSFWAAFWFKKSIGCPNAAGWLARDPILQRDAFSIASTTGRWSPRNHWEKETRWSFHKMVASTDWKLVAITGRGGWDSFQRTMVFDQWLLAWTLRTFSACDVVNMFTRCLSHPQSHAISILAIRNNLTTVISSNPTCMKQS